MLNSCSVDFNEMLHRMQSIELYEKVDWKSSKQSL